MWHLSILIVLTIFLYLWLKTRWDKGFKRLGNDFSQLKSDYDKLVSENERFKKENSDLTVIAGETIALYEITQQLCKSLDENSVFSNFCEQINKHLAVGDCKFLKDDRDLETYSGYTVFPLRIDNKTSGYLLASQIQEKDKDKFYILAQQFMLGIKRAFFYQKIQELAITDALTGVFSRRYLLERLTEEIERSQKFKFAFSFLMLDIDHFKDYNDRYGHLVGDVTLREASQTIKENIRQIDLVGRYGGEEFSIILTETDKEGARFAAERIRQAIEQKQIKAYDEDLKVTISMGISTFPTDGLDAPTLIDKADQALYQAKQAGRNRVCVYRE